MALKLLSSSLCYGGDNRRYSHSSTSTGCEMKFHVFLPPQALQRPAEKFPALYFLSGLTCTDETFITKSGVHRFAAEAGMIIVAPDTSPRGFNYPDEVKDWDFGASAGFYVDATQKPWSTGWQMYSYITRELPDLINSTLPVDPKRVGISGHSMGGHGAMVCALRNPDVFRSISAFAPISHPMSCPWGQKAFTGYLGSDKSKWEEYDAAELITRYGGPLREILVDQGSADKFLAEQLKPEALEAASGLSDCVDVRVRRQEGYDHSYYFITSFIEDHIKFHFKHLSK